jgi:hypothetical protein
MAETIIQADKKETIPRSARLPSASPEGVRLLVGDVAEIAGAVSRERLASHLNMQKTGAFSRAVGSALLYGFLEIDPDRKLVITARGSAFAGNDAAAAKRAEREGIASTGFGLIIKKLSTRAATESVIALRLQEDLGVPHGAALDRASLLVAAATDSGLIANGNFDGGVIEDTFDVIGRPEAATQASHPPNAPVAATTRSARSKLASRSASERVQTSRTNGGRSGQLARNADLPSTPPSGTKRVVGALAELGGPASRERVAGRLKAQLTGRLAAAIASAILYGFMELDEDEKLIITERGSTFIDDDTEAASRAQREAIMSTGFAATIQRLRTHKADEEIVSARLQEDFGLPENTATERAKTLVKAAVDAGLAADGRFVVETIEDTVDAVGGPAEPTTAPRTPPKPRGLKTARPEESAAPRGSAGGSEQGGHQPTVPFERAAAAPLSVVLQVDASKLTAAEIKEIAQELAGMVTVSIPGS